MVGAIIMLRTGSALFKAVSLLPIMADLCYAAMTMMTRKLGIAERAGALETEREVPRRVNSR